MGELEPTLGGTLQRIGTAVVGEMWRTRWIYDAPTLRQNVGNLLLARGEEIGSKLCFHSMPVRIRCVLKSNSGLFFCA